MTKSVLPSEEGTLEWWPINALPTDRLVEDLPVLLPKVLALGPADPPLFVAYSYGNNDRLMMRFAEQV